MKHHKTGNKTAAFFDLDKTLLNGESQAMEARYLIEKNRFSPVYGFKILGVVAASFAYKNQWMTPWRYNQIYVSTYKGQQIDWLKEQGYEIYGLRIKPALFAGMLAVMEMHRRLGHLIVLISATAEHLLEPVKNDMNADFMIATKLETTPLGICTGKAEGRICVGKQKRRLINQLARIHGIDLDASYAYSDHHADIPFLSAVGNPVAVNPTRDLKDEAEKNRWKIMITDARFIMDSEGRHATVNPFLKS
jgi:putative phosphoserine phosphatase/1-acylglycerol-3-phosphate O-acyltransferase